MPRDGTNHAHGDRAFESQRVSERHHQLPLAQVARVAEREPRQVGALDSYYGKIRFAVGADQPGRDRRFPGSRPAEHRQLHLDLTRALNHVVVRNDVTVRRKNHARARAALFRKQVGGVGAFAFFAGDVSGGKDLDHRRPDQRRERFERGTQIAQCDRIAARVFGGLGRGRCLAINTSGRGQENRSQEVLEVRTHLLSSWHRARIPGEGFRICPAGAGFIVLELPGGTLDVPATLKIK